MQSHYINQQQQQQQMNTNVMNPNHHQQLQQQQQLTQQQQSPAVPPQATQPPSQQQQQQLPPPQATSFSGSQLCRLGQENVQDIVHKTMELFNHLKNCHPPNGTTLQLNQQLERKKKIAETLDLICNYFKRLRRICEKVNETTSDMEFLQIESLIPLREDSRGLDEKKKNSEVVRKLTEERNLYAEHLRLRNRRLKEIIDMLRDIVWDINTMLAMRKP